MKLPRRRKFAERGLGAAAEVRAGKAAAASVVLPLLVWSTDARAVDFTIYDNAQSVPIGARAAGMGGAYTALACDEGALHYNPASLSCAASSHLELTANAYVLQGLRATGALGPAGDIRATTYHSIPSIVGAVRILREGESKTFFDTYPRRLTFGFSVSLPRTLALDVDPPKATGRDELSASVREDLTVADLGLGYQLDKEVSIGLALGGVVRTSERHLSWLLVDGARFRSLTDDRSSYAIGAHAKLGLLVRPYKNLSFGVSFMAPSIHVYGVARQTTILQRADESGSGALPIRAKGSSEVGMPARLAVGFAFVKRRYTFSGDVSLSFGRTVRVGYDMRGSEPIADHVLSPSTHPNINAGASVPFGTTKEVNIGFFTDFSSVSQRDIDVNGLSRVHMFGSALTVGFLGKQSRVWVGAAGEVGHTTSKFPGRQFTYGAVAQTGTLPTNDDVTVVRWTATGILGSNYSFLD
jgi:hypothetical protein